MKLSEKIKALRKGAGLSQEAFGARLNVSRQAITKWESGEGLPDIGNLLVLSRMFKISVDDEGRSADVNLKLRDGITETLCREALHVEVILPQRYVRRVEIAARVRKLSVRHLEYDNFEFGGKAEEIFLSEISGNTELDVNSDVVISADSFSGELSLNQIGAVSTLHIPAGKSIATRTKGIRTRIICEHPELISADAADLVELNGIKSELTLVYD